MQAHRKQVFRWLVVTGLLLALGVLALNQWRKPGAEGDSSGPAAHGKAPAGGSLMPAAADASKAVVTPETVARRITADAGFLGGDGDPASKRARLDALRAHLLRVDSAAASAAIRSFLESGGDASSGLPFRVGGEGTLEAAPTLRVFLLDVLGSIDPPSALEFSRRVMDLTASADEYAIALRNLAWNDSGGDLSEELRQRFEAMLARDEWRAEPADGFLEALDAAVLLGDAKAFTHLLDLNRWATDSGGTSLSRACFIALDRMVEADAGLLETFGRDPGLMDRLTPDQKASLWSRLDIARPAQRGMLADFLSATEDPAALEYFAAIYPNGNRFHVNRLFSAPNPVPSIAARMEADRAILRELGAMQLPAGSAAEKALDAIRRRLAGSLEGARAAE